MKLNKLQDAKGNTVYINPDHVLFVGSGSAGGVPSVGEAAVMFVNGLTLAFKGNPDEVANLVSPVAKNLVLGLSE